MTWALALLFIYFWLVPLTMYELKQKDMNWFLQLGKRFTKATPSFFQKIIYFGITLGTIGLGIQQLGETMNLPLWLIDQADNMIIVGAVAAIVAKATVKDPHALKS